MTPTAGSASRRPQGTSGALPGTSRRSHSAWARLRRNPWRTTWGAGISLVDDDQLRPVSAANGVVLLGNELHSVRDIAGVAALHEDSIVHDNAIDPPLSERTQVPGHPAAIEAAWQRGGAAAFLAAGGVRMGDVIGTATAIGHVPDVSCPADRVGAVCPAGAPYVSARVREAFLPGLGQCVGVKGFCGTAVPSNLAHVKAQRGAGELRARRDAGYVELQNHGLLQTGTGPHLTDIHGRVGAVIFNVCRIGGVGGDVGVLRRGERDRLRWAAAAAADAGAAGQQIVQ